MNRNHSFVAFVLTILAIFCSAPAARAQGSRHDGIVLGPQGRPVAGATIAVCTEPATITTTPCSPLATLYTDATLTVAASNPLTSDGVGNYHFYAAPGIYTVQVYGPGINTYTMQDVILPINPTNPNFGNLSALTLSLGGNLSVGGNANITGSLSAGSLNFGSFNPSTISTTTLSVSGATTLSGKGNVQLKPQPPSDYVNKTTGENIVYVSPNGSDSNDCLSWGTACQTLYHAYELLPIRKLTVGFGGGQIFFSQQTPMGGPVTNQGLWVMGIADPNYCTISASNGLVRASNVVTVTCAAATTYTVGESVSIHNADNPDFDGTFTVAGVSGNTFTYNQTGANETSQNGAATPAGWLPAKDVRLSGVASQSMTGTNFANEAATQLIAGSGTSASDPGIWLNGVGGFSIDHVSIAACVPILIGEDSNGKLNDGLIAGLQITNSTFTATATSGCGPTETIGSNSLWVWEDHDTFGANSTAAQTSDQRANILLNGGTGAASSSQEIYVTNVNFNGAGGIKLHGASMPGSWNFYASKILEESDGTTPGQPVVWIADSNCAGYVYADNLATSDGVPNSSMPTFENDSSCPPSQAELGPNVTYTQAGVPTIQGPALLDSQNFSTNFAADPLTQHEFGRWGNPNIALPHLIAQVDDSRRGFAPSAVRFANVFDSTMTIAANHWATFGTGTTTTTGISAPDGTTGAVEVTSTSTSNTGIEASNTRTLSTGDWFIGGVWAKPHSVGGTFGNPSPAGGFIEVAFTNGVTASACWPICASGVTYLPLQATNQGDGRWEWIPFAVKIGTGATNAGMVLQLFGTSTNPIDYYAPTVFYVPSGTISDSEAVELMQTSRSYSNSCPVGSICGLNGENLVLPGNAAFGGGRPWTDVAAFGAKCDDTTDDTAAIQAALASLPATGGILRFAGVCKTTSTITINTPNVTFEGQGHFQFITQNAPLTYIDFQGTTSNALTVASQGFKMEDMGIEYPSTTGGPLNPPSAPVLSQVTGSGCPVQTEYAEITYVNPQGQTLVSPEASFAVTSGNCLHVASPAGSGNATGYNVYVSANSNNETLQNSSPISIGTAWTQSGALVNLAYRPLLNTTTYSAIYDEGGGQYDGVKIFTPLANSAGTSTTANGFTLFGCCVKLHNVYIAGFGNGLFGAGGDNDTSITDSFIQSNYIGAYLAGSAGAAGVSFVRNDFENNTAGNIKLIYGTVYTIYQNYFEQQNSPPPFDIELGDTSLPPQGSLIVQPGSVTISGNFMQCNLTSGVSPIVLDSVISATIEQNSFSQCGSQNIISNTLPSTAHVRIRGNISDTAPGGWLTSTSGVVENDTSGTSLTPSLLAFYGLAVDSTSGASSQIFRSGGSSVWSTSATSTAFSWNYNAHNGETTAKFAPFGGQSFAGFMDNYGMTAGFVPVSESSGGITYDAGLGNTFEVTLNANNTTTNLINAQPGQWLNFIICQPASGGPFTSVWPTNIHGGMTIGTTAGKCSAQSFVFDGTNAFATSPGLINQ
jgi:hypothetical protein